MRDGEKDRKVMMYQGGPKTSTTFRKKRGIGKGRGGGEG